MVKKIQLPLQTSNLIIGFMVWVLISSLMPFIREDIAIDPGKVAIVTAVPVVLGSILRIPLGYYANILGARVIFMASFILLLIPVYYLSIASSMFDLILAGTFIGVGGAVFSVGVTSLPKYYPKEKHGLINGIYGMGNVGTAVTTFAAPVLATKFGWSTTVQIYLIILALFALLNFFLGDRREPKDKTKLTAQIKGVYKDEKLWLFSLFYFITFGSFVAFTVFLPSFLVDYYALDKVDAGLRTAGFIAIATGIRPVGGWLADKFQPLFLLMGVFIVLTFAAIILAFTPAIHLYTVGVLMIAFTSGIGNGVIFKLVPFYFNKQAGIANGIVSMMGGLGGFFPPLLLAAILALTGSYSIGFMAFSQVALASFILVFWLYHVDKLSLSENVFNSTSQSIIVTDERGKVVSINPAFTKQTGYEEKDIIGQQPNILKSDKQREAFYRELWEAIKTEGEWTGEVWNRKKNGEDQLQKLTINAIRNNAGDITQFVGTIDNA